jgi:prefoldin alpha subunit
MDDPREELEQMIELINRYREQGNQISMQLNILNASLNEHMIARETIQNYGNLQQGDETLIPVGGNSYIRASASENKKVLIGIGADYVLEKGADECIAMISSRIENMQKGRDRMAENLSTLEARVKELTDRAETLARTIEG